MEPRILTIDDDAVIRATVCATVCAHACRVLQAASGAEGLAMARQERPNLILLDYDLPDMNGAEVLAQLKADPQLGRIPVVMLTVNSRRDDVQQVLKLGVTDYVIKPFTKSSLVQRLGRLIPLKPRAAEAPQPRRADEPLNIVVADDKPAIAEQIRGSLAARPWTVHVLPEGEEVVAYCAQTIPDLILISLSLPGGFGFTLFNILRTNPRTEGVPILGLVPKTSVREQLRAQQLRFNGFVTKPIDLAGLPLKITSALGLDTSERLFQYRDNCLMLMLPARLDNAQVVEVGALFRDKLCREVEAGLQRALIDFTQVERLDENLIELAGRLVAFCTESDIRCALVGPESLRAQCRRFEKATGWVFSPSCEAALAAFESQGAAPAGAGVETSNSREPEPVGAGFME